MKILRILVFLSILFPLFSANTWASDDYRFIITGTNPANGEVGVPTNLKDGNCQNQYCALMVGLGNSDKSPVGHGYPFFVSDSINTSMVQISGPNGPSQIKVMGQSEGGGDSNFYHSNALFLFNQSDSLYYLEPNSRYSVTFKGGISGVKAQYDYGEYFAYLDQDYTFSFTTGNSPTKTDLDFPTPTLNVVPYGAYCMGGCITATPSPKPETARSQTSTLIPTLVQKPTVVLTVSQKQTNSADNSSNITNVSTESANSTQKITPTTFKQEKTNFKKMTLWEKIKLWWKNIKDKITRKSKNKSEVVPILTPTPSITPTKPENTPTQTPAPVAKFIPKPTVISRPATVISENILKTNFGINDPGVITTILNDFSKLENYEREYYSQLKGWPELNTKAPEQRIFIPSLNSTKICKTANIIEIKNASISVENQKSKSNNLIQQKVTEFINMLRPKTKIVLAASLDEEIQKYTKDYNVAKDTLNELIKKYCRDNNSK